MGWVYFIGMTCQDPQSWVKIGFTSCEVQARRATLQTGSPFPLDILAYAPGTLADERRLHIRFSAYRGFGEWFALEGFFQAYVQSLIATSEPLLPAPTLWTDVWVKEHSA